MRALIKKGLAYHHAGMLPTVKEVVERLFTSRLIKLIFTTETFALGINMPAKTVIFDELEKFHGTHFGPLTTRNYYQMAGRAGRRGMDEEGYVYSRVNPNHIPYHEVQRIITGKPESVTSQFNATYATILNLYRHYQDRLLDIYPDSFHAYLASNRSQKRAMGAIRRKIDLLKNSGYIESGQLTHKGNFAASMFGYELPLSELLADGTLDTLDAIQLNILLIALVYEPRKGDRLPTLPKDIYNIKDLIKPCSKEIRKLEKKYAVWPPTKKPFFHLASAIKAWSHQASFQDLEEWTASDEGEIVRYFRMVIQLLRLLRDAPGVSDRIKGQARKALELINRDEIDAEKQLRV